VKIFIAQKLIAIFVVSLSLAAPRPLHAQSPDASTTRAPISIAILDFGGDATAIEVSDILARSLTRDASPLQLVNRDLTRAAARGAGYAGSLNLTRTEARDLGSSIGSDFFLTGRAELLRRSSSATNASYYEAYAAVFLVSTRTGRLVLFEFTKAEAAETTTASAQLRRTLAESVARLHVAASRAREDETVAAARAAASAGVSDATVVIEDAPEGTDGSAEQALRFPQPYRRIRPAYTEQAMRASVEATVDAAVEIGADGAADNIEIERWAGFGLDEAVIAAIRAAHFRPATRRANGEAVPMRVLLRYNFRSPKTPKEAAK